MKRKSPREIIEIVSKRENKKNFTYSLTPEVVKRFSDYCKTQNQPVSVVLEEILKDFVRCAEEEP